MICEAVNSLYYYNNFMVYLLSTIDDLLLLDFCTDDIEPVREKFSDIFLKEIDTLL